VNSGPVSNLLLRIFASSIVALAFVFLLNDVLIVWLEWPGALAWLGLAGDVELDGAAASRAAAQFVSYPLGIALVAGYVLRRRGAALRDDAERLSAFAAYLIRAAFWSVLLVGLVDMLISFLRIEGFMESLLSEELNRELARPSFRGQFVHYPLMALSLVIAAFTRSLGFIWLTVLVVIAEFQIVISRFVFSYEQAFMGDLVRFWYAALFLFASAYALVEEGHVRVDVFYARFRRRTKAWSNAIGSLLLGMPLCWTILLTGMWERGSSINSPLMSFEISQSGYGMYVKYLMAGFLVVFAVSMIVQFASYFLHAVADLRDETGSHLDEPHEAEI